AMHQRLQRKQGQNRERREANLLIRERRPNQDTQENVNAKRDGQTIQNNHWCTGEDSNLRSSQGAADLQSAAINHSATCADTGSSRLRHMFFRKLRKSAGQHSHRPSYTTKENQETRKHTSAQGLLRVGRIPLRSAFW